VRGIRSWERDGAEERKLQIQNAWGPIVLGPLYSPIPTVYLQSPPQYTHISSTLIRSITEKDISADQSPVLKDDIRKLVPEVIVEDVVRLYGSSNKKHA
jgi:phosphopantetheine adenylyltransferase